MSRKWPFSILNSLFLHLNLTLKKTTLHWFFEHASWNGMTVADLLMAWFMFMAGVSLELSFNSRLRRGVPRTKIAYELYRRVARLWLLGVFLINGPEKLETMRFPGVLQRFAWAFLIHGTVMLAVYKSPATRKVEKGERFYAFQDLIGNRAYVIHWIVMGLLTAIFVFITFLLKVPGCPTGYLGPAGLQNAPQGDERRWADGKVFIVGQNEFSDLPLMLENVDPGDGNQYGCAGGSAAYKLVFLKFPMLGRNQFPARISGLNFQKIAENRFFFFLRTESFMDFL